MTVRTNHRNTGYDTGFVIAGQYDGDGKRNRSGRSFLYSVRPGKYVLKVSFVGYKTSWKQVTLTNAKPRVNTGEISLMADATLLEGVEIVAQAPE